MFATNLLNIVSWLKTSKALQICAFISVYYCIMLKFPIILQKLSLIHSYSGAFLYMGSINDLPQFAIVSPIPLHVSLSNFDFMLLRSYPFSISVQLFYACYNFILKCLLTILWWILASQNFVSFWASTNSILPANSTRSYILLNCIFLLLDKSVKFYVQPELIYLMTQPSYCCIFVFPIGGYCLQHDKILRHNGLRAIFPLSFG